MVRVFVGDEDGIQVFDLQLRLRQAGLQLPDAESAIDQQAAYLCAAAGFHHRGIARAAATQVLETQHVVVEGACRAAPL